MVKPSVKLTLAGREGLSCPGHRGSGHFGERERKPSHREDVAKIMRTFHSCEVPLPLCLLLLSSDNICSLDLEIQEQKGHVLAIFPLLSSLGLTPRCWQARLRLHLAEPSRDGAGAFAQTQDAQASDMAGRTRQQMS